MPVTHPTVMCMEGQGMGQHLCLLILTPGHGSFGGCRVFFGPGLGEQEVEALTWGHSAGGQAALGAPLPTHLQPDSLGPLNRFQDL